LGSDIKKQKRGGATLIIFQLGNVKKMEEKEPRKAYTLKEKKRKVTPGAPNQSIHNRAHLEKNTRSVKTNKRGKYRNYSHAKRDNN